MIDFFERCSIRITNANLIIFDSHINGVCPGYLIGDLKVMLDDIRFKNVKVPLCDEEMRILYRHAEARYNYLQTNSEIAILSEL